MKKHEVKSGECLSKIAGIYGFRRWQTIYEAPENKGLRDKRPNPNILYPGDEIVIPEKCERTESGSTEARHRFKCTKSKWVLKLKLLDEEGEPLGDEPYEIEIAGLDPIEGRTEADGTVKVEVPATARSGKLTFMGEEIDLAIGQLDPASRVRGIQARLNNLGYAAGPVDGGVGKMTRRAVRLYQLDDPDLKPTGNIDDDTRKKLGADHEEDKAVLEAEEDMSFVELSPHPSDAGSDSSSDAAPDEEGDEDEDEDWGEGEICSLPKNYLLFDGKKLCWMNESETPEKCWPAVSGRSGFQSADNQDLKDRGPIPEGSWIVKQKEYQRMPDRNWIEKIGAELGRTAWPGGESAWGRHRIWLHPLSDETQTFGRSGFSIHGGDTPGSAGCIDLTSEIENFIDKFLEHGQDVHLLIDY